MATKEFEDFKGADPAPDYSSLEPESRRFLLHQCRRKGAREEIRKVLTPLVSRLYAPLALRMC
jgi:hypothetical protein